METFVAGIALIVLGLSGVLFRRVFRSMARSPSRPAFAPRAEEFMRWRGWLVFELALIAVGLGLLVYGTAA